MINQCETFLVKSTFKTGGTYHSVSFLCHGRESAKNRITKIIDDGGVPEVQRWSDIANVALKEPKS